MKFLGRLFAVFTILLLTGFTAATQNQQSLIAFGLTNLTLGQAAFAANSGIPVVTNLSSNGLDGISILLGEADSAAFIYPDTAAYPEDGDYMLGKAYGKVESGAEQVLCTIRGRRTDGGNGFGVYPVEVDFSPLGSTNLLFQVFSGRRLVAEAMHPGGEAVIRTDFNGYRITRVNPYWRLPDGTAGAMFEFTGHTGFNFPETFSYGSGGDGVPFGDRLFVRPVDPTNVVQFVSRIDVTSGGEPRGGTEEQPLVGDGLPNFQFDNVQLGVFRHAHLALGQATLLASGGQLTVDNLPLESTQNEAGVSIELEQVSRISLSLAPVELGTNAALSVSLLGVLSQGNYSAYFPAYFLGSALFQNHDGVLQLSADFPNQGTNLYRVQVAVYNSNVLVGTSAPVEHAPDVTLGGQRRLVAVTGLANTLTSHPGLALKFDEAVSFSLTNQNQNLTLTGDEIRILTYDPFQLLNGYSSFVEALTALNLTGTGLPSVGIRGEVEERPTSPLLSVTHSDSNLLLSWPDPNQKYVVQWTDSLSEDFTPYFLEAQVFSNNVSSLSLDLSATPNRFFRLIHSGFLYGY